jgi:hypothetical protein
MTLEKIIEHIGTALDDNVVPYLWSNEELTEYLNQSIEEWCRLTDANVDKTTVTTCQISVTAGTSSYALNSKVLKVLYAYIDGEEAFLEKMTTDYMLASYGVDVLSDAAADRDTPRYYSLDYQMGYIKLWPSPVANGTLKLSVSRLPITELAYVTPNLPGTPGTGAELDIPVRFHRDMIAGVLYRAYKKNDADTESLARAKVAKTEWDGIISNTIREIGLYQYVPRAIMPEYGFI